MQTGNDSLQTLLEMDRFVRLMAVAPCTDEIVAVVRAYLASWSGERVARLRYTDEGWAPFDEYCRPYLVGDVGDVRQIGGSVRIRYREREASGAGISRELLELDLFFFFANESLESHEAPARRRDHSSTGGDSTYQYRQRHTNERSQTHSSVHQH